MSTKLNLGTCDKAECTCRAAEQQMNCTHFSWDFDGQPLTPFAAAVSCRKAVNGGADQSMMWLDFVDAPDADLAELVALNQGRKHVRGGSNYQAVVTPLPTPAAAGAGRG